MSSIPLQDIRPWGGFASLAKDCTWQVKILSVSPGGCLSLQSHEHRDEHWIVVEGQATVTIDDKVFRLDPNETVFIPAKARHRLENETDAPVAVIEVQYGDYLGEDDIVRYDDVYGRQD
ncbi:MAG: phosphomannose isomerase type II C-terminal cupin domain [Pseudomonadota bacterium]|nr:phosphomannose isomerase type II C-terminal cupin domain [Pseudomonadota bacterium]